MTMAELGTRKTLDYLLQGTQRNITSWGFQYLNYLAGDISQEYQDRIKDQKPTEDLMKLVNQIVPNFFANHSEEQALDLLLEVDKLDCLI